MKFNTKLYIEGYDIDLTDRFEGSVMYSLDNIKDISTISSTYSTTITLPGTLKNCQRFNYLFNPKVVSTGFSGSYNIGNNYDFKRKAKAVLLQDGQIILDGFAKLVSANVNNNNASFDIQISSPISSLISNLGDIRLEDLYSDTNISPYDHALTLANITGSWNISCSDDAVVAGRPYVYPLIDSGQYDTVNGSSFYTQNLRVAPYLKSVFDACFATASFTYESDFLNDVDYFQKIILPYKDGDMNFPQNHYVNISASILNTTASQNIIVRDYTQDNIQLFTGLNDGGNFISGSFYPTNQGIYSFTVGFNFQIYFDAYIDFIEKLNNELTGYVRFAAYTTGSNTFQRDTYTSFVFPSNTVDFFGTSITSSLQNINVSNTLQLNSDEYARISVTFSSLWTNNIFLTAPDASGIPGSGSLRLYEDSSNTLSIDSSTAVDGNVITWKVMSPKDIKCSDLVQSVLRLWNLYPVPDPSGRPNHLIIKIHDQFYSNTNTLDWTDKLSKAEDFTVTPIPQIDTGYLLFALKDDNDYWNTLYSNQFSGRYGQLRANLNYEFSKDTKDVLDGVIFSPTVPVQYNAQLFPCEQPAETSGSRMNVFGYSSSFVSTTTSSLNNNPFSRARKGGKIIYNGGIYNILNVINPQSIQLDRQIFPTGSYVGFQYITNTSPTIIPLYQSKDNNITRGTLAVNPRILFYNGLRPVQNPIYVQYTPQLSNISYSFFSGDQHSNYWMSTSMVPHCSHLNNDVGATKDLLFAEPGQVFFNVTQYPTSSLFDFWENSVNEIADPEAKLITAKVKLNGIDISNLDFSNRIHIDGTNYRLSAINNYTSNPNETTEIELVRQPFQVYLPTGSGFTPVPPPVPTSSIILPVQVSASVSSLSTGSAIIGIDVSGSAVSYISGNNFGLSSGQRGLFSGSIASQGANTVTVHVSSSGISDSLYITDFATTSSYQITGSGIISTSKVLLTGSILYVSVQPFIPNTTVINGTAGKVFVTGVGGIAFIVAYPGETKTGYHTAFTGAINCNIQVAAGLASNIRLIVNGTTVQTLTCTAFFTGDRTFSSRTYSTSDTILIDWETDI